MVSHVAPEGFAHCASGLDDAEESSLSMTLEGKEDDAASSSIALSPDARVLCEYCVWVLLYMEGGGEWAPVSGVDDVGHSDTTLSFDGQAIAFPLIALDVAQ